MPRENFEMSVLFRQLNRPSFNIEIYNWILPLFFTFYMLKFVIKVLKCRKRCQQLIKTALVILTLMVASNLLSFEFSFLAGCL